MGLVRLGLDVGSECLNLNEGSHYRLCTSAFASPNSPVFYKRPIEELNCQRDHLHGSIVIVNTYITVVMDSHRDCLDST